MNKMLKGLLFLFFMIILVGCSVDLKKELEFKDENGLKTIENKSFTSFGDEIVSQWLNSAHATPVESPSGRDDCILCHDGVGFAKQNPIAADLEIANGQNCLACHSEYGSEVKKLGLVDIPAREAFEGGKGALCMECHNARRVPNYNAGRLSYPHYGAQSDVYTGTGVMTKENEEIKFNNTFGHISMSNSCVDCHMPKTKKGFVSHTFSMEEEYAQLVCSNCHENVANFNIKAKGDYDGSGSIEGIQTEIENLKHKLHESIVEALGGGSFETSHGAFYFSDVNGEEISEVPKDVYLAAYNYYLIKNDGSLGVHNPKFSAQILQYSYEVLTGKKVEGADIVK